MKTQTSLAARCLFFLLCILGSSTAACAENIPAQSIKPSATLVSFAQTLDWFDATHFAIGRWDGTISLYRTDASGSTIAITQAMALPSGSGVEMLTAFDEATLVSSDGTDALAIWHTSSSSSDPGKGFELANRIAYADLGAANSGLAVGVSGEKYFISGHDSGMVAFWRPGAGNSLELIKAVDVKSPNLPSNPWGIRNIRGLAFWRDRYVVTGSEDGDLVGLEVPGGKEIFRVRYNEAAKRGINNISILGDLLLVANCAVGPADKNLWLYDLSSGRPVLKDAENLALDLFRPQVFDFDADLVQGPEGPIFFSSTEEGMVWMGRVADGQLLVSGITKSAPEGGSVMDVSPDGKLIVAVTYAVRLFKTQ